MTFDVMHAISYDVFVNREKKCFLYFRYHGNLLRTENFALFSSISRQYLLKKFIRIRFVVQNEIEINIIDERNEERMAQRNVSRR